MVDFDLQTCSLRSLEYRMVICNSTNPTRLIRLHRTACKPLVATMMNIILSKRYAIVQPRLTFGCKYGHANKGRIALPDNGRLRIGLVLHEFAHVLDLTNIGWSAPHGPRFVRILDELCRTSWTTDLGVLKAMMT